MRPTGNALRAHRRAATGPPSSETAAGTRQKGSETQITATATAADCWVPGMVQMSFRRDPGARRPRRDAPGVLLAPDHQGYLRAPTVRGAQRVWAWADSA